MRTQASDKVYRKPENRQSRKSKKELIADWIKFDFGANTIGVTCPEIAKKMDLDINTVQKRCSDLFKDGRLMIEGNRDGHSIYFQHDGIAKMTKPEAYKRAVRIFCLLEDQLSINKFVRDNT